MEVAAGIPVEVATANPWFIDAWAVYDGVAFASRSAPEVRRTERVTEAETTVFLSVPELEPIPVGRITTGLRAARASFQDGFFDNDGIEIAFASLDGIREVIRRTYLVVGLGPGGAAMAARPTEPSAPSTGGRHFAETVEGSPAEDGPPLVVARRLLERERIRLRQAVRGYAEAVLIDWEAAPPLRIPHTEDALAELHLEFADAGIWRGRDEREEFATRHAAVIGRRYLGVRRDDPAIVPSRRYSAQELIALAPCPALPFPPAFSRFSDPLKLSFCDSQYLADGGLRKAAQLLAAAVLVGVGRGGPSTFWHGADEVLDYRMRQALDWIERQLPRATVPEGADRLVNEFAHQWLQGPPDLPAPFSAPVPSSSPSSDPGAAAPAPAATIDGPPEEDDPPLSARTPGPSNPPGSPRSSARSEPRSSPDWLKILYEHLQSTNRPGAETEEGSATAEEETPAPEEHHKRPEAPSAGMEI